MNVYATYLAKQRRAQKPIVFLRHFGAFLQLWCIVQGPFETKSLFCWQITCSLKTAPGMPLLWFYDDPMLGSALRVHIFFWVTNLGLKTFISNFWCHQTRAMWQEAVWRAAWRAFFFKRRPWDRGERWTDTPSIRHWFKLNPFYVGGCKACCKLPFLGIFGWKFMDP